MMKRILFWTIAMIITTGTCDADGPQIFVEKKDHDYGEVLYGATVSNKFVIQNTGDKPLIIKNIHADCGCANTVLEKKELAPESSAEIIASFETTGLDAGRKAKKIYIETNDPTNPTTILTLYADVIREISVNPMTLGKKIRQFEPQHVFNVRVTNSSDSQRSIKSVRIEGEEISVFLFPESPVLAPRTSIPLDIRITINGQTDKPYYLGKLFLETDHPIEQDIELKYLVKIDRP